MGVTAHYIVRDHGNLLLRSGLLAFRHIKGSHTGENLARILFGIIREMEITHRVSGLAFPSQTLETSNQCSLQDWFHYCR